MTRVLLDISEMVKLPLRTGIQRVTRELIRFWPGDDLVLCRWDPADDALHLLPEVVRELMIAGATGAELSVEEERDAIGAAIAAAGAAPAPDGPILNVELFIDPGRAGFYERLAAGGREDLFWLLYDFIPWLQPQWFPPFAWRGGMDFLHAALRMPRVSFISEATRGDFLRRMSRGRGVGGRGGGGRGADGPVIALGGDGLGLERQHFARVQGGPARQGYVTLGTLEPRKRIGDVMEAFLRLWDGGSAARLTVIGRLLPNWEREWALVQRLRGDARFSFLPNASDEAVREVLRGCRAMIFPSASEGFGLPPFEALFCGIPVIGAAGIPALDMLPPGGRVMVPEPLADGGQAPLAAGIAAAVEGMEDDAAAARLWGEAAGLPVPSWADFAAGMAGWVLGQRAD